MSHKQDKVIYLPLNTVDKYRFSFAQTSYIIYTISEILSLLLHGKI